MKIAIYGGTFDPVHVGHVRLLEQCIKRLVPDKVLVIPTFQPPHKHHVLMADADDRLEMCRLAFSHLPCVEISDIELKRTEKSYSIDTVSALKKQYPDDELYFIMGGDMFLYLEKWYRYDDLKQLITFVGAAREHDEWQKLCAYAKHLEQNGAKTQVLDLDVLPLSSSEIREKTLFGEPTDGLVPEKVADFVRAKQLYAFEPSCSAFKAVIREKLEDKRFHHSLCVADSAAQLARKNGANPQKAYLAGLLHDITKQIDDETQLHFIKKFGILLEDAEQNNRALWHAASGCAFVKGELGLCDQDLLNAIRYHTTSRAGASLLEDILYVADFVSEDRDYPDVAVIREKAERDLREAKLYGLSFTIWANARRQKLIGLNTVQAYNETVKEGENK